MTFDGPGCSVIHTASKGSARSRAHPARQTFSIDLVQHVEASRQQLSRDRDGGDRFAAPRRDAVEVTDVGRPALGDVGGLNQQPADVGRALLGDVAEADVGPGVVA